MAPFAARRTVTEPLLNLEQGRRSYEDGGVRPNRNTQDQHGGEIEDHRTPHREQSSQNGKRRAGCQHRPRERLVDGPVHQFLRILAPSTLGVEILPDTIEYHDRVVQGIPDDREDGRHRRQSDFDSEHSQKAERDQNVMHRRNHRGQTKTQFEPHRDVDECQGKREQNGQGSVPLELRADLGSYGFGPYDRKDLGPERGRELTLVTRPNLFDTLVTERSADRKFVFLAKPRDGGSLGPTQSRSQLCRCCGLVELDLDQHPAGEVHSVILPSSDRENIENHCRDPDEDQDTGETVRSLPIFDEPVLGLVEQSHEIGLRC